MNNFINLIEKLFFPWDVCCNGCKSENVYQLGLCKSCFQALRAPQGNRCEICLDKIDTTGLCKACLQKQPDYRRSGSRFYGCQPHIYRAAFTESDFSRFSNHSADSAHCRRRSRPLYSPYQ